MAQLLVSVKRYMGLPDSTVGASTAQGPFAKLYGSA
jgi:hypothetical protein